MSLIKRKRERWLSAEQACELLGIEDTEKTPATRRLSSNAARWGIRKIRPGTGNNGAIVYPEIDLYAYMAHKERDAEKKVKVHRPNWRTPQLVQSRANKKWLSARAVAYMLGLVTARAEDTPEQLKTFERNAIQLLNKYARHWGIRKIEQQGIKKRSLVTYPEDDVIVYMERKEREAKKRSEYMSHYPTHYPPLIGPGLDKWWGDKLLEQQLQVGKPTRRTGEPNAKYIKVEIQCNDAVPPLRGYVEVADVAQRFNISSAKVLSSNFWGRFCVFLADPFHSAKRYNGDLIELYFEEKRAAGEKVYMLRLRFDKRTAKQF
jgi:hypothetical protein